METVTKEGGGLGQIMQVVRKGVPSAAAEDWLLCEEKIEGECQGTNRMNKSPAAVMGERVTLTGTALASQPTQPCPTASACLSSPPSTNSSCALGIGMDSPPREPPFLVLEPGGKASMRQKGPVPDPPPMPALSPSANRGPMPRVSSWHRSDSPFPCRMEGRYSCEEESDQDGGNMGFDIELEEFSMAVKALDAEDPQTMQRLGEDFHEDIKRRRLL